jgi:ferredoxin--NADP+ reductase
MMCGNPDMLNDLEAILQNRGMTKHKLKSPGHYVVERYW